MSELDMDTLDSLKMQPHPPPGRQNVGASAFTAYFRVTVVIDSLVQVPYITGLYYCKWTLPSMTVRESQKDHQNQEIAEKHGSTAHSPVRSHKVSWEHPLNFNVAIPIDREGMLKPCIMRLYVKQEWETTGKSERIGEINVNLSEYASLPGAESVYAPKAFLLGKSKTNAALRLSINLEQYQRGKSEIVLFRSSRTFFTPKQAVAQTTMSDLQFSSSTIGDGELTLDSVLQDDHGGSSSMRYPQGQYLGYGQATDHTSLLSQDYTGPKEWHFSDRKYGQDFLTADPICLSLGPVAYYKASEQIKGLFSRQSDG